MSSKNKFEEEVLKPVCLLSGYFIKHWDYLADILDFYPLCIIYVVVVVEVLLVILGKC